MGRKPATDIAERDDVVAVIAHQRRHQHVGQPQRSRRSEHQEMIRRHRRLERMVAFGAPIGQQAVDADRVDDGTGQDMGADLAALFQNDDRQFGIELLEPDGCSEPCGAGADDHDVKLHAFAFDLAHPPSELATPCAGRLLVSASIAHPALPGNHAGDSARRQSDAFRNVSRRLSMPGKSSLRLLARGLNVRHTASMLSGLACPLSRTATASAGVALRALATTLMLLGAAAPARRKTTRSASGALVPIHSRMNWAASPSRRLWKGHACRSDRTRGNLCVFIAGNTGHPRQLLRDRKSSIPTASSTCAF